ncbi:MAG TPA: ABC transporter permease [Solirubrobacteraceae bacterium]|nr:ABC transporter permease [Solirubrobacteraceae bacterium]
MSVVERVVPAQLPPAREVKGPTALAGSFSRFVHLTWTLAVQDFKLRFFGSILGYLWQLMRPLMLFGVLYVVFTQAIRIGAGIEYFAPTLLMNIVLYTFFGDATGGAVRSVVERENLVRKIHFPRLVVPGAVVLTAMFNLALNLFAVAIFVFASGVPVRLSWLMLPLLIMALVVFATGIAMLLSALYVRLRDVGPIWEVIMQVLFYGTPIIYVIELVHVEWLQQLMMMNPLGAILQQVRHTVIDPGAPSAAEAIGGAPYLLIPAGIVLGLFALGYWVFSREAPRIAEDL